MYFTYKLLERFFFLYRHGMYRTDHLIYNDPELSFLESIPKSALFTPNPSAAECGTEGSTDSTAAAAVEDEEEPLTMTPSTHLGKDTDSEDEKNDGETKGEEEEVEGTGAKPKSSAPNSTPVPLGWPKVHYEYLYLIINQ